jgi:protein PhnA
MPTESQLLQRSDSKCELCTSTDNLNAYEVAPSDASADQSAWLCQKCSSELGDKNNLDTNHWRCLNDSMWSPTPAIQVLAWRQLTLLSQQGETWAQELLDIMYMEDQTTQWAQALEIDDKEESAEATRDCNGVILKGGDSVTIIKDLDVKGGNFTAKRGTPVRNISLTNNPEQIEGRVNGQRIVLLSCYLKKN